MKGATPHTPRSAFSVIELLTAIAIISVLVAVIMPAVQKARERSMVASKVNQYRQYFYANSLYANENNGFTCPAKDVRGGDQLWQELLSQYLVGLETERKDHGIFIDPFFEEFDEDRAFISGVGLNVKIRLPEENTDNVFWNADKAEEAVLTKLNWISYPETRIFAGDSTNWFINTQRLATDRHDEESTGMFVRFDGSVTFYTPEEAMLAVSDPAKL